MTSDLRNWFKSVVEDQDIREKQKHEKLKQERRASDQFLAYQVNNNVDQGNKFKDFKMQLGSEQSYFVAPNLQNPSQVTTPRISLSPNKGKIDVELIKRLRLSEKYLDVSGAFMGLTGVILSIAEFEWFYDNGYVSYWYNDVLRSLISIMTFILLGCIGKRAYIDYRVKVEKGLVLRTQRFHETAGFRLMLIEILVNVVHCPPRIDFSFQVNNFSRQIVLSIDGICMCIMLLRVYLLSKLFAHYSKWLNAFAQEQAETENCEVNITFAVKAVLKEKPNQTMIFLMLISDIVFALAVRHFELAYYQNEGDYPPYEFQDYGQIINSMWLIMITMMTVGFGDYYPRTHLGRAICIIACFWGVFIVSMMVVTLTNATTLSQKETRAYGILYRLHLKKQIQNEAAIVITRLIKLAGLYNRFYKIKNIMPRDFKRERLHLFHAMNDSLVNFRNARSNLFENELTADEILRQITEQMDRLRMFIYARDLNDIRKSIFRIGLIRDSLREIEGSQDVILTVVNEVTKLSKSLDEVLMKYRFHKYS